MNRLYILVEGPTEERFVKDVLSAYFLNKGIYITPIIISNKILDSGTKFKGGNVTFNKVIHECKKLLNSGYTTTLLDYYGIDTKFKGYKESLDVKELKGKKDILEKGLADEIKNKKFIPNIQMHEFESLLFSNIDEFQWIEEDKDKIIALKSEISGFETPEHVNNSKITAPSKRILKHYPEYNKVLDGINIAQEIGIEKMMVECPLFRGWIEEIEKVMGEIK